mgnify:CR=1 FL=1
MTSTARDAISPRPIDDCATSFALAFALFDRAADEDDTGDARGAENPDDASSSLSESPSSSALRLSDLQQ